MEEFALDDKIKGELREWARANPSFVKAVLYHDTQINDEWWYVGAKTYMEAKETSDALSNVDGINDLHIIDLHQFWD
jgi:hypothetical protein